MKKSKQTVDQFKWLFQTEATIGVKARGELDAAGPQLSNLMQFLKTETPLPEVVIEWLSQLGLLYGVPFNHLVADEKMMEYELEGKRQTSVMRFFYLDPNWIDSLIGGALSIGTHNSKDFKLQLAIHKAFQQDINKGVLDHRVKLRGKDQVDNLFPEEMGTLSGLLFRSPIIVQWPGIEVVGYPSVDSDEKDPDAMMDILRLERLSPSILLVIFKGVPQKVIVREPSEGIHSGFKRSGTDEKPDYQVTLRRIKGENKIGIPYQDNNGSGINYTLNEQKDFRNKDKRVLNIRNLKQNLTAQLKAQDKTIQQLSPKDMAVQFVNSPRFYIYTPAKK